MSRATTFTCTLIGAIAIAAGGWGIICRADLDEGTPRTFQAALAQDLAIAACRCQRHAGPSGRDACWAAFHRKMSTEGIGGTACAPVAEENVCGTIRGPTGNSTGCIVLRYDYVGSGKLAYLCTRDEAMAVEAAWYSELLRRNRDRNPPITDFSTPETDQMVRDLTAGKPVDLTPKRRVCSFS